MKYNWQQHDWPEFRYDESGLEDIFLEIAHRMGRVDGLLTSLSDTLQTETLIEIMVVEAIKTSEIEGEYLSRQDVMSSIRHNLGLDHDVDYIKDKRAEGAAKLMIDVREQFKEPLSEAMLFSWHETLMAGARRIKIGGWREHAEAMQVISGPFGKETVHYEAPPSSIVPDEMTRFITWFNSTAPNGANEIKKPALRSAIAHLYFETIHPFEDGNGRIGRAISEKALSQGVGRPILLSLSRTIEANKNDYYDALKEAQRSNKITPWLHYFVNAVLNAQIQAEEQIDFTLQKTKFFDRYEERMNERQLRVIRRMLENGIDGFEGGMSAKKYMSITKASKATATRDLQDLAEMGALLPTGEGRSRRYHVNL